MFWFIFSLLTAVFALTITKLLFALWFALAAKRAPERKPFEGRPFISIHIATHNEPPELVQNTLRALSALDYERFEVLVLDNNTPDEKVWRPVEAYCRDLGARFRFYHKEGMTGFKAGALNYLKGLTDPRAKFIAVVDADYEVDPSFLNVALEHFVDDRVAFVQFPQANMDVDPRNAGLALEYRHFFDLYMNMANRWKCVNSTGTLTVYRVNAIKQVGLFDPEVITEDADMGLRILAMPEQDGVYAPIVIGRGTMPFDLGSYKRQKGRWARGNAAVLQKHFLSIFLGPTLTWRQKFGMVAELTAWLNFTFIPILLCLGYSTSAALGADLSPEAGSIASMCGAILFVHVSMSFLVFAALYAGREPAADWTRAFVVHLGSNWVYATSFLRAWVETKPIFERTNKFIRRRAPLALAAMASEFAVTGYALLLAVVLVARGDGMAFLFPLLLIAAIHACVYEVRRETAAARDVSMNIMQRLRAEFID